MRKWSMWLAAAGMVLGSLSTGAAGREGPQIRDYEAPGNLESNYNLGCIALKDVRPEYNPVDLFKAMKVCIVASRYEDAVRLFAIAGTFGRYDALRVADPTSHQAIMVARMKIFGDLPDSESKKYNETASAFLNDAAKKSEVCAEAKRIGPPSYYPRYMVQHGMGAFFSRSRDGLVKNFNSKNSWDQALSTYLKCTAS